MNKLMTRALTETSSADTASRVLAAIDGDRSIGEILNKAAGAMSGDAGREFLRRLWEYDQIIFDAKARDEIFTGPSARGPVRNVYPGDNTTRRRRAAGSPSA
jgi:hypothetical protein